MSNCQRFSDVASLQLLKRCGIIRRMICGAFHLFRIMENTLLIRGKWLGTDSIAHRILNLIGSEHEPYALGYFNFQL